MPKQGSHVCSCEASHRQLMLEAKHPGAAANRYTLRHKKQCLRQRHCLHGWKARAGAHGTAPNAACSGLGRQRSPAQQAAPKRPRQCRADIAATAGRQKLNHQGITALLRGNARGLNRRGHRSVLGRCGRQHCQLLGGGLGRALRRQRQHELQPERICAVQVVPACQDHVRLCAYAPYANSRQRAGHVSTCSVAQERQPAAWECRSAM